MSPDLLLGLGLAFGFYMAWNIGANDVANAFGTSVGSGSLTFRRALVLAAIFEFSGAFFAGSHVADTIKCSIVQPGIFEGNPILFARGMLAALLAASLWLHLATFLGQPVSTTHAIIGAVIGFGVVAVGPSAVMWHKLGRIAASWFISPVIGGIIAFLLYLAIRRFILASPSPVARAKVSVPVASAAVCYILLSTILPTFLRALASDLSAGTLRALNIGLSLLLSAGVAWFVYASVSRKHREICIGHVCPPETQYRLVEGWFGRMEVLTACYMSFAHGANDVANAIGPIGGIVQAARGTVDAKAAIPMWLLAFGGVGIVLGLAMYGRRVIEAVGKKITEITPTRGFSAAFGTASTVLVCSLMGLPVSTTFVLVGAVMGVGFARGFGAIDMSVIRRIFLSWLITIPVSAVLAAILYWTMGAIWP